MVDLKETPSQTAGPYVHIGLATEAAGFSAFAPFGADIAGPDAAGERIRIEGVILDGKGAPMTDALLEIWQADAQGRYSDTQDDTGNNTGFTGFGRAVPDFETGQFAFDTIKPGATDGAPCLHLWLVARGINLGLHTRMYFDDEPDANATDPVLNALDPARRPTLIATRNGNAYRFDIRVQGDNETVFFDV
ncbi:protocatechuate 3,4-dioxygenase subunit alpha [Jannaschia sp. EhC01]|nr:protocatechuate 3,4-dioxygenase subunit alpha [Jannaschia sp. EhC01]